MMRLHLTLSKAQKLMIRIGMQQKMNNSRIGVIGENMVVVKLMQNGWDAFNVNQVFNNYESVDLVCVNPKDGQMQMIQVEIYILSKSEVEELIRTSNNWYMNEYVRDNVISNHTPVGIKLKWLKGEGEDDTLQTNHKKKHAAYVNPLGHDAENLWDKIWE